MPGYRLPDHRFKQWLIALLRQCGPRSREDIARKLGEHLQNYPDLPGMGEYLRAEEFERCVKELIHEDQLTETKGKLAATGKPTPTQVGSIF